MTVFIFILIVFLGATVAGFVGSLTGLGGGVVLIPLLTIVFKVDIHYAIGTSLISVIATSSGAAAAYVKEGITNIRLGMFLENKDLEFIMSNLLRYGVMLSASIVFAGVVIYLWQHGTESQHYKAFSGEPNRLKEIKVIWQTALQGRGRSVIQLGLLTLIATPIARILFSVIGFLLEKDILYIAITLLVLAIILFSLF